MSDVLKMEIHEAFKDVNSIVELSEIYAEILSEAKAHLVRKANQIAKDVVLYDQFEATPEKAVYGGD